MSNQNGLALQGNGQTLQMLDHMSRSMQRNTRREIEQLAKRTIVACVLEEGRAQIAQVAILGAGTVGMTRESVVEMAPMAEDNCRAIDMAYGIGSSRVVMTF